MFGVISYILILAGAFAVAVGLLLVYAPALQLHSLTSWRVR